MQRAAVCGECEFVSNLRDAACAVLRGKCHCGPLRRNDRSRVPFLCASHFSMARVAAVPLPLLCDAATNTVNDWPVPPHFPPFESAPTGPGSAYAVVAAALEAMNVAQAEATQPACGSPGAQGGREAPTGDSCSHATQTADTQGPSEPLALGNVHAGDAAGDEGVPRARRVAAHVDSSDDDEFEALYLKYGVTPPV